MAAGIVAMVSAIKTMSRIGIISKMMFKWLYKKYCKYVKLICIKIL